MVGAGRFEVVFMIGANVDPWEQVQAANSAILAPQKERFGSSIFIHGFL